ncbi:MAG: succinate dehydrogenase [Planctomycetes bacterium]|nr:succinate dehydrogenase [Planctomycetota bacterium]MCW8137083.1 succinate dehydrogenase [Planctomycetota bacterium]
MNTATASADIGGHKDDFLATTRSDPWWKGWAATAIGLTVFFGYLTVRVFQGYYMWADPYLSPLVAPPLFTTLDSVNYPNAAPLKHAWLGTFPAWWPRFVPQSPGFMFPVLAIMFRMTCYYYRKAYYRAFFATPPGCAVRGAPLKYRGETALLLVQNLHRYALYGALFLLVFLWYDVGLAFFKNGRFGIGVGTLVMLINVVLISGYTFGCHSWRHLIGGRKDCFSCDSGSKTAHKVWKKSTWLNQRHMLFAWLSLVWVAFTDFYIMLCSKGVIKDLNTW